MVFHPTLNERAMRLADQVASKADLLRGLIPLFETF